MSQISGQITIVTAGVVVRGPDISGGVFILKALTTNSGVAYFGNDGNGTVSSLTGIPLAAGESLPVNVSNLSTLYFNSTAGSEKIAWVKFDV